MPIPGALAPNESSSDLPTTTTNKQKPPAQYEFSLEALIARLLSDKPLDSVTRSLLTIKMEHIKKAGSEAVEEIAQLWKFCDSQFANLVQACDNRLWQEAQIIADKLRLIVLGLKNQNFASRLLREAFLVMEEMFILNVDMNLLLLQNKLLPVSEWDEAIASYVRDCSGQS